MKKLVTLVPLALVVTVGLAVPLPQQGPPTPPDGHPFAPINKLVLVGQYLDIMHSAGASEPYALAYAAWVLNIPNYTWTQGLGPILARLP